MSLQRFRRSALALAGVLAAAALVAGCGSAQGGGKLEPGIVARVGGEDITQARLDEVISKAKGRLESQGQKVPAAGSAEYQAFQQNALQFIVQRIEFGQKAAELGVKVSEKDVNARLERLKAQFFGGSDKKYEQALQKQGLTDADVRDEVRATLISEGVFAKVSEGAKVTEAEIAAYYNAHPELYRKPSRDVRHILVKSKALAERLRKELLAGADFAKLAKRYSQDPGSSSLGGKYTVTKGQFAPEFEKAAFGLKVNEISQPVKTQYGWHIIQALGPVSVTPLKAVKETIRQTLTSQKQSEAVAKFLENLKKEYESKITYASGFAPPSTDQSAQTSSTG